MDPDISIMLQSPSSWGLSEDRVRVELSPRYNRRPLPEYEALIAESWSQRCLLNPWLFNGAKFRIHSASLEREESGEGSGEGRQESGVLLRLQLGLTCYRDFMGTNWAPWAAVLQQRGLAELGDSQGYLAEPLGVGAMLLTADDSFVFLKRSERVGEAPGKIDIPGGHPEPKAVAVGIPEECIQLKDLSEELVVQELFFSVLAEIRDEVNLPLRSLHKPILLGIARNHTSAGRASAEFYIRCSLTSEEVNQFYWEGGPEAQESTNIVFIKKEEVLRLEESAPMWSELCPSAKGAVKLYNLVQPA
ncbi:uridine diphosphate glucose pyrophosphatase NUDT22 [Polyodon spathula]|uniref:uridine diphosphate glucose pyrophosphatase NUDT22 n=1 Tax=Polyodon spathula TaxID=7913 RepID=UPI001B7DE9B9|nr:uridine diphosphate glucose pyrophosphatase NUDT22 [Polyodon spathula]XP_041099370.1 uridine diphosphate glucose pyrophosphatase NUDT22 [Polyodon spathula]